MKEISIIVPTFNRKGAVKQCIDSLLSLKYLKNKYEIIIVDDGSTDGTLELLKSYTKKNKNFRFFRQNHKGCAAARNLGIMKAKGKYLFFTDSDDVVKPNWIRSHLRLYKTKDVAGTGGHQISKNPNLYEKIAIAGYREEFTKKIL